jgi:hypothetical protein
MVQALVFPSLKGWIFHSEDKKEATVLESSSLF